LQDLFQGLYGVDAPGGLSRQPEMFTETGKSYVTKTKTTLESRQQHKIRDFRLHGELEKVSLSTACDIHVHENG